MTPDLATQLAQVVASGWLHGQRPRAEDLLAQHPELAAVPEAALRVIYEELCQRQALGELVTLRELLDRFPQYHHELAVLFDCQSILGPDGIDVRFPEAGTMFGDVHLIAELGRGAMGRVFLAEQTLLAGRLVVVKITPLSGREHLQLARLQHTHIVPLFGVCDVPDRHLRQLTMPCMGGAALHAILKEIGDPVNRTGRDLLGAMERVAHPLMIWPGRGGSWRFLQHASYDDAICWLGAGLADGLECAHDQGLVHLDIKPSNVLLTADGVPMLLDFHVAREPLQPGGVGGIGGTPLYMAPEQRRAAFDLQHGRPIRETVDGRADLFALGLLLCEAFTGVRPPNDSDAIAFYRPKLARLSPGLRAILAKCLETNPAQRYSRAALLADDLRRHLGHRPLKGVPNRNIRERWRKWRTRQPYALSILILVCAVGMGAVAFGMDIVQRSDQDRREFEAVLLRAESSFTQGDYRQAAESLRATLDFHPVRHGESAVRERINEKLRDAMFADAVKKLHARMDALRFIDIDAPSRTVLDECRTYWSQRDELMRQIGRLPEPLGEQLRSDLTEVGFLLTTEGTPTDDATPWGRALMGRQLLRSGDNARAADVLSAVVRERPHDFWAWFWLGQAEFRRQRFSEAVAAFSVCIGREPTRAECYFNRGRAWAMAKQPDAAQQDYDQALRLAPGWGPALLNRGVLHLDAGRLDAACADFEASLNSAGESVAARYNIALVYSRMGNEAAARRELELLLKLAPQHVPARDLLRNLRPNPTFNP